MTFIRLILFCGILGGCLFGLFLVLTGVCSVFTERLFDGLKRLVIGLSLLVACVFFPAMLFSSLRDDAHANTVSIKGKVVNADGNPVKGAHIKVVPDFTNAQSSEPYNHYPQRVAVSDSNGSFELTGVRPLSIQMTARYLVNSNVVDVSYDQFFFGQIYAGKSHDMERESPKLTLPLISESRIKQTRRYLLALSLFGRGWIHKERDDVCLPRSKGNVIFLPDIMIDDEEPRPSAAAKKPVN